MRRFLIVLGLAACTILFLAVEANAMTVEMPYQQTFRNPSGATVESTFDYQITAGDPSSPMPEGTTDGVYRFTLEGSTSGQLDLDIPFSKPGYYHYNVEGNEVQKKAGYTYDTRTYTVMVMVMNGNNGLQVGAMTIQDPKLSKYAYLPFRTGYGTDGEDTDTDDPSGDDPNGDDPEGQTEPAGADGAPGNGGNGGNGTPAGGTPGTLAPAGTAIGGNGPPTGTPGNDPAGATIGDNGPPLVSIDGNYWSLPDLILTILTVITSIAAIILIIRRRKKAGDAWKEAEERSEETETAEAEEEQNEFETRKQLKWKGIVRALEVIPAIGACILFILKQDLTQPMGWIDEWTIWHLIILIVNVLLALISRKVVKDDEEPEETTNKRVYSMNNI